MTSEQIERINRGDLKPGQTIDASVWYAVESDEPIYLYIEKLDTLVPIDLEQEMEITASVETEQNKKLIKENTAGNNIEDADEVKENFDSGTRSNPVSMEETKTQETQFSGDDIETYEGIFSLTISNPVRGEEVYNYLMRANKFNEEAPEGMEWVMVDVEYVLVEASTEDIPVFIMPDFVPIDSNGSEVRQDQVYPSLADGDEFGYAEVYSGGNATGKYVFYAPVDDEILLKYDDFRSKPIFFNLN